MALSPREEDVLARVEAALRADDPALAAALTGAGTPGRRSLLELAVALRHVATLCAVLLVLVVAITAFHTGVIGSAVLTATLVGPWLLVTVGSRHRPSRRSPGHRSAGY